MRFCVIILIFLVKKRDYEFIALSFIFNLFFNN